MTDISRTMLVTHRSCLDGTGSALMYVWGGGRRDRVLFRNPSGLRLTPDEVPPGVEEVWYADCCPQDLTDPAAGRPFRVFDHHVSAQRVHGKDPRCVFDMDECGTSLMANRFALGRLDEDTEAFVEAMRDYDLGRFENSLGRLLADLASTYAQEQFLDLLIEREAGIIHDVALRARASGAAAVREIYCVQAAASAVVDELRIGEPGGDYGNMRVVMAAVPRDWKNDAALHMLDRHSEAELAVIFDVMGGMVSLRSREDGPDCSRIAGLYGGGGHRRAAGFRMPIRPTAGLRALSREVFG